MVQILNFYSKLVGDAILKDFLWFLNGTQSYWTQRLENSKKTLTDCISACDP